MLDLELTEKVYCESDSSGSCCCRMSPWCSVFRVSTERARDFSFSGFGFYEDDDIPSDRPPSIISAAAFASFFARYILTARAVRPPTATAPPAPAPAKIPIELVEPYPYYWPEAVSLLFPG